MDGEQQGVVMGSLIRFDPESHTYTVNGNVVPNVTSILKPLYSYSGVNRQVLDDAAERGKNVHKICEMEMYGILDESSVHEEYAGYLSAFRKFIKNTGFQPNLIEHRVYHERLNYAGTIDIEGCFPGRMEAEDIIDIKTTAKFMPSVGPQTMAYKKARGVKDKRFALQLKANADFNLVELKDDARDWSVFVSCLNVLNFMQVKK